MTTSDIRKLACEAGFDRAYVLEPAKCERPEINRYNKRVADDCLEVMEDAKSVIVLLKAYAPYEQNGNEAQISAYYPVSNEAYHAAKALAEKIEEEGYKALFNVQIAIKPLLLKTHIGQTGRNSLVSVEGLGTRFHAQIILTDANLEKDALSEKAMVSEMCLHCGECAKKCPSGAIGRNGRVDVDKCLRSRDDGEIVPETLRKIYANRLLGCDVCQDVCPRNEKGISVPVPEGLKNALSLSELLKGNVQPLTPYIGRNYARRSRIRMKAALAANLGRFDLINDLIDMAENGTEGEKEHAAWALAALEKNKNV